MSFPLRAPILSLTWVGLAGALAVVGCASEGTVRVTAYGEDFIEQGIAAAEFSDGWAVTFDRFAVSIRDVTVAGKAVADVDPVDLTLGSAGAGQLLGEVTADANDYGDASFTIDRMEVEGNAVLGDQEKRFVWVFEEQLRYTGCESTTTVNAGETSEFQITVHADHLFYDSLVADEPSLVFQPFADADSNMDGLIEADGELWEARIGALDPGNQVAPDLWTWLILAARTVGHADGEGHCDVERVLD